MNKNGDNMECDWMICRHKLYHFTVANTRFKFNFKTKFVVYANNF